MRSKPLGDAGECGQRTKLSMSSQEENKDHQCFHEQPRPTCLLHGYSAMYSKHHRYKAIIF